ncbi:MAG: plasmid replication protein RepC [Aestuariivita sp.]|nr:plasmid replication protein RepC [Aestuariivita sp.]MCY4345353.1 plasmid replication protein RepC [Aestuariivita sp.]
MASQSDACGQWSRGLDGAAVAGYQRVFEGILEMTGSVHTQPQRRRDGWRQAPANLLLTEELARDGAARDVSRNRAAAAVKAVAAAIGLKLGSIVLLDAMLSLSEPQDWGANCRPLVWPGNIALMEKTGLSLSALRRHIKVLEKTGLIICRDSANGRRFGHRDKKGVIVEAYGFDLSPLKARVEDFEALGQQLKQERVACQQLRNKITSTRRTARALIQHACDGVIEGIWAELTADLDDLLATKLSRKPTSEELKSRLDALTSLLQQIKEAVAMQEQSHRRVRLDAKHKTTPIVS